MGLFSKRAAAPVPKGVLEGHQFQPWEIAQLAYGAGPKWKDAKNLSRAVMICFAESQGYARAHNDNKDSAGNVVSRDVGLWEINIPASQIGTKVEEDLYDPVKNVAAAYKLYAARGFQPWASYNSNVFLNDGYTFRSLLGTMNFLTRDVKAEQTAKGVVNNLGVPLVSLKTLRKLYSHLYIG